jgi:hypothetical protein
MPKFGCLSQTFCPCLLLQHPRQTITKSSHVSLIFIKSAGDTGHAVAQLVEAQAARLQVWFPMVMLEFFIDIIFPAAI